MKVRSGSLQAWAVAMRPRSLWVALSPVMVGAALGVERCGSVDLPAAGLVLGCALLMQVITNLQNDVGYTVRGGERSDEHSDEGSNEHSDDHRGEHRSTRTGLPRATANGWLSVRSVRAGIVLAALLAAALGLALVAHRGWPVLAIGMASLLAALAYMGGPKPIAYSPFGELTVFVFFGMVAVIGTDWVLTGSVGTVSVWAAVAIGSLAAAALAVNNHRDITHDRGVGRRTFAVSFGERASQGLFSLLLCAPFALLAPMALAARSAALLLPLLLAPAAWRLRRALVHGPQGSALNEVLFGTFRLELAFAVLLSAGVWIGPALAR